MKRVHRVFEELKNIGAPSYLQRKVISKNYVYQASTPICYALVQITPSTPYLQIWRCFVAPTFAEFDSSRHSPMGIFKRKSVLS